MAMCRSKLGSESFLVDDGRHKKAGSKHSSSESDIVWYSRYLCLHSEWAPHTLRAKLPGTRCCRRPSGFTLVWRLSYLQHTTDTCKLAPATIQPTHHTTYHHISDILSRQDNTPPPIDGHEINMPSPSPSDQDDDGRASRPPTPVAPVAPSTTLDRPTPSSTVNQAQGPFIQRRLTGQPSAARAASQSLLSSVRGVQPPTGPRKRPAGSVTDDLGRLDTERAAKRPANASTRLDLSPQGGTPVDNVDEGPSSSAKQRLGSLSPGEVDERAPDTSTGPTSGGHTQTSTDTGGMRPPTGGNHKNRASTRKPVKHELSPRPRSESVDGSTYGYLRQAKGSSSQGLPPCMSCGSQQHKTKDCHFPSSDGTVVICPFHDCSIRYAAHTQSTHSLDGRKTSAPGDKAKAPLYCTTVMRYETAVWTRNASGIRSMLPNIFRELVVKRRRKPCCRVINMEVCPINLAIEYSRLFCGGRMPPDLQGMWPYTMRDATDSTILAELDHFEDLGWEGMPPGELESKSWEQIKREYAQGTIPPQIRGMGLRYWQTSATGTATRTTTETGGTERYQHYPSTELEQQTLDEDEGVFQGSLVEEGEAQSQGYMKMDDLHQILVVSSEKVDAHFVALSEKFDALSENVNTRLDALSERVDSLSERVDSLSKEKAEFSEKKDVIHKFLDSLH